MLDIRVLRRSNLNTTLVQRVPLVKLAYDSLVWVYGHYKYIFTGTVRGSTLDAESAVYRRQIMSSKVDPSVVMVKRTLGQQVDPILKQHW